MNVIYINERYAKEPLKKHNPFIKGTAYIFGSLLAIAFSPLIAIVCFANQFRCDHVWIPNGKNNSCVRCTKKQPRKELLGLEKL